MIAKTVNHHGTTMRVFVVLLIVALLSGPVAAKESPGDVRRKWKRYVSPSRIKPGVQRVSAERLLAAKLIAAKAVSPEEIFAYYELDSEYMVCVRYDASNAAVLGAPTLLPNSDRARKNLTEWAAR